MPRVFLLSILQAIGEKWNNYYNTEIDSKLNLTFNKAEKRTVNYALSNTFGFGGHNASIILKAFEA